MNLLEKPTVPALVQWRAFHATVFTLSLFICAATRVLSESSDCPQLAQLIAEERSDSLFAARLLRMQFTERFDQSQVARCLLLLPGHESRAALQVVADETAFLDPPAAQLGTNVAPDMAEQRRILSLAVPYVTSTMHHLPNFFAVQTTTRFESLPKGYEGKGTITGRATPPRTMGTSRATVTYRDGNEVESEQRANRKARETEAYGLRTWGLFGPVLAVVLHDAGGSTLSWQHWEIGDGKTLAVFRYLVPFEKSNYSVTFCCAPGYGGFPTAIDRRTAYHGELTIDPATGAILRLTLQSDLDQADLSTGLEEAALGNPLTRADLAVDYDQVEIGAQTYICPVHSVALSQAHTLAYTRTGKQSLGVTLGPEKLYLNDSTFAGYHLFRSESRILPTTSE